jgi:aspartyl protease family protein
MSAFDLKSAAVLVVATASAISVGLWLNHADGRGEAAAGSPVPAAEVATVVHAPAPAAPTVMAPARAQVLRAADGHYRADAMIDGRAVRVLVDTGASVVALTRDDALRLGIRLQPEDFISPVNTASGPARAARVILPSVTVGGARIERVEAMVVEKGLTQSLLGMSYLGRLSGFEATPQGLTLRP